MSKINFADTRTQVNLRRGVTKVYFEINKKDVYKTQPIEGLAKGRGVFSLVYTSYLKILKTHLNIYLLTTKLEFEVMNELGAHCLPLSSGSAY